MTNKYLVELCWDGRWNSDTYPPTARVVRAGGPLAAIRRAAAEYGDPGGGDFCYLEPPIAARRNERLREGIYYLIAPTRALWVRVHRVRGD